MDGVTFTPRAFRPAPWAPGPDAQTLFARLLRPNGGPPLARERLATPDDDFLDLDWGPSPAPDAPIALVLHGLEGSAQRRYVRNVCRELARRGVQPVALNFRGCSGEPNRAPHYYHSGKTDDPVLVLRTIQERYPGRPLGAIGFSLGGNMLLKLLGERPDGGSGLLTAAAVISVPYDLAAGCALLEESLMGHFYASYFLRSLRGKLRWKEAALTELVDLPRAEEAKTIREFDDRFTAPLNGFEGASDYYARCSSVGFLGTIRVPTLLLHALDDPFLPPASVPHEEARANPALHLALQPRGGHVGFLEGTPWSPRFWAEEESARFVAGLLLEGVGEVRNP